MVEYITSLPGIYDHKMKDGTTAFAIALARKDIAVLRTLMAAQLPSDIDHKQLAHRAILDLERNGKDDNRLLREVLLRNNEWKQETLSSIEGSSPRQKIYEE